MICKCKCSEIPMSQITFDVRHKNAPFCGQCGFEFKLIDAPTRGVRAFSKGGGDLEYITINKLRRLLDGG